MKVYGIIYQDEAHVLKNPLSRIGDCFKYIPYKYRYVLTATPLPNSPLESFNYLKWGGKVNINWWDFKNRYAVWGGRQDKEIIMYQHITELRQCIQNNMLRRLKKDKLKELPDVTFRTIPLDMTPKQQTLYNAVKKEILEDLKDTSLEKVPSALAKLLRLQQVTDSPAIIGAEAVDSSKLLALDDLLEELIVDGGQKVILFSRFRTMAEILHERYRAFNPAVIHGDVDANGKTENQAVRLLKQTWGEKWNKLSQDEQKKLITETMTSERQNEVYKFQNDSSCKLFIGCSPAVKEGVTLTASSHVVFLDVEWSWDYVNQAYSRAHRIGQKNAVTVYFLVCRNTIDEYTLSVIQKKKLLSGAMLNETNTNVLKSERVRDLISEMIGESCDNV